MAFCRVTHMLYVPFRCTSPCSAPPLVLFKSLRWIYAGLIKSLCMDTRAYWYPCHHCQSVASSRLSLQSPYSVERVTKGGRDCLQELASRLHLSHATHRLRTGTEEQTFLC